MKTVYLLPCSCGRKLPIETSQAGSSVRCECGLSLAVPALTALQRLERAEVTAAAEKTSNWGLRQGLIFAGVLLTIAGLIPIGVCLHYWPSPPTPLTDYGPAYAIQYWQSLPSTLEDRLNVGETFRDYIVRRQLAFISMASLITALGIGLCVAGLVARNTPAHEA